MDPLSEIVGTLRVGSGAIRRLRPAGPWGFRYSSFVGAGFHVLLEGSCWLVAESGPPMQLRANDIVLVPRGTQHALSHAPQPFSEIAPFPVPTGPFRHLPVPAGPADADMLCGAYRLEGGTHHAALNALPDILVVPGDEPALSAVIELLKMDATEPRPGADLARAALIDLFLVHTLRAWQQEQQDRARTDWTTIADPVIAAAVQRLHDNPERAWSVQSLSTGAGLSRTAFTRRFTAVAGKPPMTYLTAWRLNSGARMLRESDEPLAAIARRVGYSSEFAFSAAFRRQFGTSPGHFRRSYA